MNQDRMAHRNCIVCMLLAVLSMLWWGQCVYAEDLSDPTRPALELVPDVPRDITPVPKPTFTLGGIKIGATIRSAIVNGQVVGMHDVVDGATVLEISASRVVLSLRGEHHVLRLLPVDDVRLQASH